MGEDVVKPIIDSGIRDIIFTYSRIITRAFTHSVVDTGVT